MLFNIYYLNTSKVYEIAMMINNVIIKGVTKEDNNSKEKTTKRNSHLSANYLKTIKSSLSENSLTKNSESNKIIESLEIKTTKSILLKKIIDKSKNIENFKDLQEGDLVKISNVKLALENEEEVRQVKLISNQALKGFKIEGFEVNNLFHSMLKDYAYLFTGTVGENKLMMKIPLQFENEFENLYNFDDLVIGNVTIIGVYKKKIVKSSLKNTFNFLQKMGEKQEESSKISSTEKIRPSTSENKTSFLNESNSSPIEEEQYHFIDLIAVVQDIYKNEEFEVKEKINFFKRILMKWRER